MVWNPFLRMLFKGLDSSHDQELAFFCVSKPTKLDVWYTGKIAAHMNAFLLAATPHMAALDLPTTPVSTSL